MQRWAVSLSLLACLVAPAAASGQGATLVEVRKIWDQGQHNAFTDLVRFKDRWYCTFREGKGHVSPDGALRVITSSDGREWTAAARISSDNADLRDSKLSVTPDGRLMLLGAGALHPPSPHKHQSYVWFSEDGAAWSEPVSVGDPDFWLWRVTWHGDAAYGIGYATAGKKKIRLYRSADGRKFDTVADDIKPDPYPNETRLLFLADGTCLCLLRRDGGPNSGLLGRAAPPYTDWTWKDLGARIGGPEMIELPDGRLIACVRLYDGGARTSICGIDPEAGKLTELLRLPSGGDTSYAGLVWHDDLLWVSYYSSHEGKTSIYLAKVKIDPPAAGAAAIDLGTRLEPMIDHHLIERLEEAQLRMHRPRRAGVALKLDQPWERNLSGYFTVIFDEGKYKLYYRGRPITSAGDGAVAAREVACYAESEDGKIFTRPNLGLFEVAGTRENNVILTTAPVTHNFAPFVDGREGVPREERYKAVGGSRGSGLLPYVSADGIRWRPLRDEPIITGGAFDSQNNVFWSEHEQRYVCFFRTFKNGVRWISRTTSKNFIDWEPPVDMTFGDAPHEHLYTNQTEPYYRAPHLYIGTAARFWPKRSGLTAAQAERIEIDHPRNYPGLKDALSDGVLLTSRGGHRYDRTFLESFIRPGADLKDWTGRSNYPCRGIVETGPREISLYIQRQYGQPTTYLERLTLRTDGFASVWGPYQGGTMLTRPITFSGSQLVLNFATSAAGGIRVEIQDEQGQPIPGYALADCPQVLGDDIERTVAWKGGSNVSDLAGKPIRLRFEIKDGDLYSLRFK